MPAVLGKEASGAHQRLQWRLLLVLVLVLLLFLVLVLVIVFVLRSD
jgi:hypothetical protein